MKIWALSYITLKASPVFVSESNCKKQAKVGGALEPGDRRVSYKTLRRAALATEFNTKIQSRAHQRKVRVRLTALTLL